MELVKIKSQSEWDMWLKANSPLCPFAQSWQWGDVLIADGLAVERLGIVDDDQPISQAQIVYYNLPLNYQYAFCPKGLINKQQTTNSKQQEILESLIDYFQKQKNVFFRLEPHNTEYLVSNAHKTIDINPRTTVILDLTKSEEYLLAKMKPKTRYNIRLAGKKQIKIIDQKDLESFWQLSNQTGKRDGFRLHSKIHYKNILQSNIAYQLSASYNQHIIASAIFIGFGNTFTYLYGASDYKHRSLMAPYLLQWEGIKLGKKLGYKYYDFFGIAPAVTGNLKSQISNLGFDYQYDTTHQYVGVTRFKLGFGGQIKEDVGTYDFVLRSLQYSFYKIVRKINRTIRLND